MKGREGKVKLLLVWCRQQWDIYSQRLGQGVVFHLETHKLAGSSKQQLPQPGMCGPVCHTSFPPSLHVGRQMTRGKHSHLHTRGYVPFLYLTSAALHMEI